MSRLFLRSLRARLIIGAAIWIAIGVSAAGVFIAGLFRHYATNLMDAELRNHLEELTMHIDIDARGFPHLYRPLSDPRFSELDFGFTWQVSRLGTSLIKSLSASTEELPVPNDGLRADEIWKATIMGPRGEMIVFERMFLPDDGEPPPFRIQIGADAAVVDRMLPTFDIPLTISLALLALALITAAGLQVLFGLQPMARLRDALGAIKSGKAAKLLGDFPSEVEPLVGDLNNLIEINAHMVLRARTQAGNLAHALKTPLAILTDEADRMSNRGQIEIGGGYFNAMSAHAASNRLSDRACARCSVAFGSRHCGAGRAGRKQYYRRHETLVRREEAAHKRRYRSVLRGAMRPHGS